MEGSSLQRVMDEGTPRIINDLEEYLEAHPGSTSTKVLVREGVRSSLTCPLMVDGRPIGFAFRSSRKKGAYSQHEVALHQAIHVRLSQAVEKAWRIQQLEDANRAYMEMLGFVSHELKSPVAAIITQSKMLQEGLWGDLQPKQHEIVGKLVTRAEYLLNLTREYLDLARFEGGQAQPRLTEGLDFWNDLFLPSLEVVQPQYNESGIDLELPTDPGPLPLDADATMLKVVLVNLLGNAAKYGTPKGKVKVNLAVSEERIRFSVWNEGPGFPESMKGYLFRRFSRLPKKELITRKGSGVGLYVTWQIMQMHKGRIWADSKEGEWAEFFIDLPRHAAPAPQPQ
jgi:signal transduction histidine kinase